MGTSAGTRRYQAAGSVDDKSSLMNALSEEGMSFCIEDKHAGWEHREELLRLAELSA